jgi:hypothetical protein
MIQRFVDLYRMRETIFSLLRDKAPSVGQQGAQIFFIGPAEGITLVLENLVQSGPGRVLEVHDQGGREGAIEESGGPAAADLPEGKDQTRYGNPADDQR